MIFHYPQVSSFAMSLAARAALEALFRATGGDSWRHKANWVTDAELSTWHGVKVDEDGQVVALRLDWNNNVQGIVVGTALRTQVAHLRCALFSPFRFRPSIACSVGTPRFSARSSRDTRERKWAPYQKARLHFLSASPETHKLPWPSTR